MNKTKMFSIGADENKAGRYIMVGFTIAIIFGSMAGISASMKLNAADWATWEDHLNDENLANGLINDQQFSIRDREIIVWTWFMNGQELLLGSIGRVGTNIGLLLVFIGFVGFAINNSLDERMRRASVIIAAAIMFVIMFVVFLPSVAITVNP